MIRPSLPLALTALLLTACTHPADPLLRPDALGSQTLSGELVHRTADTPPASNPGVCWADAVTPAVYETETEHERVKPASPGAAPVYQTITRQRIVKDREQVWFRAPCPAEMTPEFIGTLQRALLARGYYHGPLSGEMDPPTRAALRHFQSPLGLDSEILSLGAARMLGLVSYDLGQPPPRPAPPEVTGPQPAPDPAAPAGTLPKPALLEQDP